MRLSRDVEVNSALYSFLLNKTQELRVVKAGTIGNVRIVDYAMPPLEPVKPRKKIIALASLAIGLILGVVMAAIRKLLRGGIKDPDQIEKQFEIPIYATIPHSKQQNKISKKFWKKQPDSTAKLLAASAPDDPSVESLRSLRTALHFGMLETKIIF